VQQALLRGNRPSHDAVRIPEPEILAAAQVAAESVAGIKGTRSHGLTFGRLVERERIWTSGWTAARLW
jgi:hypothetical protein